MLSVYVFGRVGCDVGTEVKRYEGINCRKCEKKKGGRGQGPLFLYVAS